MATNSIRIRIGLNIQNETSTFRWTKSNARTASPTRHVWPPPGFCHCWSVVSLHQHRKLLPCHRLTPRRSFFPYWKTVGMPTCSSGSRFRPRLEQRDIRFQCRHIFPLIIINGHFFGPVVTGVLGLDNLDYAASVLDMARSHGQSRQSRLNGAGGAVGSKHGNHGRASILNTPSAGGDGGTGNSGAEGGGAAHRQRASSRRRQGGHRQGGGLSMATKLSGPRRAGQPAFGRLRLSVSPQDLRKMMDIINAGRRRWRWMHMPFYLHICLLYNADVFLQTDMHKNTN